MNKNLVITMLAVIVVPMASWAAPPTPEMVAAPATTFPMGSDDTEALADESPIIQVTLDDFTIAKYPVTNQDIADMFNWALDQGYLKDVDGNPYTGWPENPDPENEDYNVYDPNGVLLYDMRSYYDGQNGWEGNPASNFGHKQGKVVYEEGAFTVSSADGTDRSDHPVTEITWYGMAVYCNWLSEINGLTPAYEYDEGTGTYQIITPFTDGFRHPTEAEWERAAAWDHDAQKKYKYGCGSDTLDTTMANYGAESGYGVYENPLGWPESAFDGGPSEPYTTPVGFYNGVNTLASGPSTTDAKSPLGCYDMCGNVLEWVLDNGPGRDYSDGDASNPLLDDGSANYQERGGSFWRLEDRARAAHRQGGGDRGWDTWNSLGFRVASSGTGDMDGDGLTDFEDASNGASPYSDDTDGDGLTDYDEVMEHETDPGMEDTDSDGFDDYTEIGAGSDPLDPGSTPENMVPVAGMLGLAALAGLLAGGMALRGRRKS